MARLPDIPVADWLADQAQRFGQSVSGYFDAAEFDDAAKQSEASIPPDYPLVGGEDQWAQAEQQNRVEELRRQQEADEQAKQQRIQELQAQQQADQERQMRARDDTVMAQARDLGIPTPDQMFGNLSMSAQQQPDHTSSTGLFDSLSPEQVGAVTSTTHGLIDQATRPSELDPIGYQNGALDYPFEIRQPGEKPYDVTDSEGVDRTNDPLMMPPYPLAPKPTNPVPWWLGVGDSTPDREPDPHLMYRQSVTPKPGTDQPITNPDGSVTTERSITVTEPGLNGGRPTNIPTVWDGRIVSDDEAIDNAINSGISFPDFDTIHAAEAAARQRSQDLGAGIETSIGGAVVPPEVQGAQANRNRAVRGEPIDETGGTPTPQPPEQEFSEWARQMNNPVFGPETPPEPDHTSSSGVLDTLAQVPDALHLSGARQNISDVAGAIGDAAQRAGEQPIGAGYTVGDIAGLPDYVIQNYGAGKLARDLDRRKELENDQAQFTGDTSPISAQRVLDIDPGWAAANPEKADELERLRKEQTLMVGGMAGAGVGQPAEGLPGFLGIQTGEGIAGDAIAAVKAMRAANLGDDLVLQAEQKIAQGTRMTLEEIQRLTGTLPEAAARAATTPTEESAGTAAENPFPLTDEERALNAEADARARSQPEHSGYLEDPSFGVNEPGVSSAEDTASSTSLPETRVVPERGSYIDSETGQVVRKPVLETPNSSTVPDSPAPPSLPVNSVTPTRALTPEQQTAFDADVARLEQQRSDVAAGNIGRIPHADEVSQVMGFLDKVRTQVSDRHARLSALQRYVERTQGAPLDPPQQAWLLARVYQGHADAALARMEQTVMPAYSRMHPADATNLDHFMEQLDNINTAAAVNAKEQNRVLSESVRPEQSLERAATRGATVESERLYSAGATPLESPEVVKQGWIDRLGPERAQRMFDAADAFYTLRDQMRDRLVSSGVWSKDYADSLAQQFPFYSPTRILKHLDTGAPEAVTGGRSFSTASDGVKHLTPEGTEAYRMAPTQAMVEMAFKAEELASRNTVMRSMYDWTKTTNLDNFIQPIKSSQAAQDGWKAMSVFVDGKEQKLQVVQPLANALDLSPAGFGGVFGAVIHALRTPLQAGATALRPAFIFTNAINDGVLTLYRFASEARNPIEAARSVTDLVRGYQASFGMAQPVTRAAVGAFVGGGTEAVAESPTPDDPNYWYKVGLAAGAGAIAGLGIRATTGQREMVQRARLAGGSQGMQSRFTNPADIVRQLRGENILVRTVTSGDGLLKILGAYTRDLGGLVWSRPLAEVGGIVENAPRYAAFSRAERQGASQPEAAQAMRRVTVDFAAGGRLAKNLNQMVPFLNAATQGAVEGLDIFRKNPVKASAMMAVITGGIIASEIHNRTVAPDEYKDISAYTRDTGIVWLDPTPPQGEGKRGLIYMPLRAWPGALVPITKAIMRAYYGDDPRTWQQLALATGLATVNQLSPVNADVGMLSTPVGSIAFQAAANYDLFRGQPIVSRSMEGLPVSEQYDDRTSQFARQLSRSNLPLVGGRSPMMLDWFARNFSPGPGEAVLGVADQMIHMSGQDLPNVARNVPKGARDVPLVGTIAGRVLRTTGSERQNLAYQNADEIVARVTPQMVAMLEARPDYKNSPPDRQKQMLRSLQAEVTKQAEALSSVPDYAKPKNLGLPVRYIGVPKGSPLEAEIASAFGAAKADRTARQEYLISMYGQSENPYWTDASKQDRVESDRIRSQVDQRMRR